MPTTYDVFAKVIEKAPCKHETLGFSKPVFAHLKKLENLGFIKKTSEGYVPIKNEKTESAFNIIRISIKTGLNYNLFFSKSYIKVISNIQKTQPTILSEDIKNNLATTKIIEYLEKNQFILLYSNRPKSGYLLEHSLYAWISRFHNIKIGFKKIDIDFGLIERKILNIPKKAINPFSTEYFENIIGSAQLEGSTVTLGETIEIIMKNIYPKKHHEDVQMVKNLNEAMKYSLENINEEINATHIKNINSKLLFSLHAGAGQFKKSDNKIHGNPNFKTAPPYLVESEILRFCKTFNEILKKERRYCILQIGFIHNEFQRIHPFPDGNSRTTRIIVNWMLAKLGLPLLTLKAGSFDKYMSMTKLSEKRYDKELNEFIQQLIIHEYLINE